MKIKSTFFLLLLLFVQMFVVNNVLAEEKEKETEEQVYLVEFNTSDSEKNKKEIEKVGGEIRFDLHEFNTISAQLTENEINELKKHPNIKNVFKNLELNIKKHSDVNSVNEIAVKTTDWGYKAINIDNNLTGDGVKIGVLGEGIKKNFDYNITGGAECYVKRTKIDIKDIDPPDTSLCVQQYETDDGRGYADNNPHIEHGAGHETFIAGIISSKRNNGFGIDGVSPNSELYALKMYGKESEFLWNLESFLRCLKWAIDNNIKVLNISYGFDIVVQEENDQKLKDKTNEWLTTAYKSGVYIVTSAGNEKEDAPDTPDEIGEFPANHPLVTVVSGVYKDKRDNELYFIEHYARGEQVDITAPAVNIYSTTLNREVDAGPFRYGNGTSYAAPYVAGTVALAKSKFPTYSNDDIYALLMLNTQKVFNHNETWDEKVGYGLVQANFPKTLIKNRKELHLSNQQEVREIPKTDAKKEIFNVEPNAYYVSPTRYEEGNDVWYQIPSNNTRAKWVSFGQRLTKTVEKMVAYDPSLYSQRLFDGRKDEYYTTTIPSQKSVMYRFDKPVRANAFDIDFFDPTLKQDIEVTLYNKEKFPIETKKIDHDGVHEFILKIEDAYYFEIKNVGTTSAKVAEFELLGDISGQELEIKNIDTNVTFQENTKIFLDNPVLSFPTIKTNTKGKTAHATKGYEWDDTKQTFKWVMVSSEELGIQDKWVKLSSNPLSNEMYGIYYYDLTNKMFGQIVKDTNYYSANALFDDNVASYEYLSTGKFVEYEFDYPVDINQMYVYSDYESLNNHLQIILTDENENTYTEHLLDDKMLQRYFNLNQTYSKIKKVKIENKHPSQRFVMREIGFSGKENEKLGLDAIQVKHPITLKAGTVKLYNEPKGKTFENYQVNNTMNLEAKEVFGYGKWAKIEIDGKEKWVDSSQSPYVTIPSLIQYGFFDKTTGKLLPTSTGYWSFNAAIDNNDVSIFDLYKGGMVEYEFDSVIETNQIYFQLYNYLENADHKMQLILFDEQNNELYNKQFTRDELYKSLINFDSKYKVKKFKLINNGINTVRLKGFDFREY